MAGNTGMAPPAQIDKDVPKLKAGMAFTVIFTVNTAWVAHCPAVGVKVYTPDVWLVTTDGLQVPVTPFVEVPGNTGTAMPAQMLKVVPKLKDGITFGVTVTFKVVGVTQDPGLGVKV